MKCVGCGVKVQTVDETKEGYVSEIHVIENGENVYCKRCFDIIHYNRRYNVPPENKLFYDKMNQVKKKNPKDVILLLLDVLDIYSGFIPNIENIIGDMKVIILINKIDLMPKSIKLRHIEDSVRELAKKHNLNVISVYPVSSKNKKNIETVLKKIDKLRYNKYSNKPLFNNCYVVGCASVGKSTFINSVKEICGLDNSTPITTSDQFQTTLDIIKVELGAKFFINDTPGVINNNSFSAYLDYESVKIVTPKSFLRVRTYQLQNGQTLFLGGLVRADISCDGVCSVSCFISNNLYVHRTKTIKAEEILETQKFKLLVPPLNDIEYDRLGSIKVHDIEIKEKEFYDIIIPGIGFLHVSGENLKIKLHLSEKVKFECIKSFI